MAIKLVKVSVMWTMCNCKDSENVGGGGELWTMTRIPWILEKLVFIRYVKVGNIHAYNERGVNILHKMWHKWYTVTTDSHKSKMCPPNFRIY